MHNVEVKKKNLFGWNQTKALIHRLFSALSAGLLITALCFDDKEIYFWAFIRLFPI